MNSPPSAELNLDVLELLFSDLDLASIYRSSGVCKLWRKAFFSPNLWAKIASSGALLAEKKTPPTTTSTLVDSHSFSTTKVLQAPACPFVQSWIHSSCKVLEKARLVCETGSENDSNAKVDEILLERILAALVECPKLVELELVGPWNPFNFASEFRDLREILKSGKVALVGNLRPGYILRTAANEILAYAWLTSTDQPWAYCTFVPTQLMEEKYNWIFEENNSGFRIPNCVERWNREDDEGIWLEDVAKYWGPEEGRGLGLGYSHFRKPDYSFGFRPYGLFNSPKEYRFAQAKKDRIEFFLGRA